MNIKIESFPLNGNTNSWRSLNNSISLSNYFLSPGGLNAETNSIKTVLELLPEVRKLMLFPTLLIAQNNSTHSGQKDSEVRNETLKSACLKDRRKP